MHSPLSRRLGHGVCGLSRTVTIAQLVEHVKSETSKWAKKPPLGAPAFAWQSGYGVFSVSPSNLNAVTEYADQQAEHHQRVSYQDERLLTPLLPQPSPTFTPPEKHWPPHAPAKNSHALSGIGGIGGIGGHTPPVKLRASRRPLGNH